MNFFKQNRNIAIIALIAIVNAIGYGIIIPILYTYSQRFGLTPFENGLLFTAYSLCQFIATPIIGRLSDKYGRKPLLVISIAGTALSFFVLAFAKNAFFLFFARILDGITAGNYPVAAAVISDTTKPEERAKGFGIIGASFGFGFVFGPAISALTLGISASMPFIVAGVVSTLAVLITWIYLPETNKHIGEVKHGKLFDFPKLFHTLFDENVGKTFLITLIYSLAFSSYVTTFQPFAQNVLSVGAQYNAIVFTLIGVVGIIAQGLFIPYVTKRFGEQKALTGFLLFAAIFFAFMILTRSIILFTILVLIHALFNQGVFPLVQTVLSKETDAKSQGTMQGLNSSYQSIGQIIGPIFGGAIASRYVGLTFLVPVFFSSICIYLAFSIMRKAYKPESAF